jgi:hypothetical protein
MFRSVQNTGSSHVTSGRTWMSVQGHERDVANSVKFTPDFSLYWRRCSLWGSFDTIASVIANADLALVPSEFIVITLYLRLITIVRIQDAITRHL